MGLHGVLGWRGVSTVRAGIPTPTAILHVGANLHYNMCCTRRVAAGVGMPARTVLTPLRPSTPCNPISYMQASALLFHFIWSKK